MSTIQNLKNISAENALQNINASDQKNIGNSLMSQLHTAIESLTKMSREEVQPTDTHKQQIMTILQSVAGQVKQLNDQTETLPKESIKALFAFLGELNQAELVDTELYTQIGQAHNLMGLKESSIASDQFKQVQHEIYKKEHQPWWKKMLSGIVKIFMPIVMITVGIVTMDPALIAGVVVATALIQTGAISDLGKDITNGLEKIGVPKDVSELIGGLAAAATMLVVSLGTGALVSLESTSTEIGGEVVKKLGVDIKKMISVGLMGGSLGLAVEAPQIVNGFVDLLPVSEEVKKDLRIVLMVIVELIAAVGMIASGGMAMSSSGTEDAENLLGSAVEKIKGKIGDFFTEKLPETMNYLADNSEKITQIARYAKFTAMGSGGTAQVGVSVYEGEQATVQRTLGHLYASLTQLLTGENINEQENTQGDQDIKAVVKQFSTMISEIGKSLSIGENAAAEYLSI